MSEKALGAEKRRFPDWWLPHCPSDKRESPLGVAHGWIFCYRRFLSPVSGYRRFLSTAFCGYRCFLPPFFGYRRFLSLLFPWKENGRDQTCVITFSIEGISDILGSDSVNTTFMINDSDELLLHPETDRVLIGESFKNHPLVMEMRQGNHNRDDSMQVPFVMEDGSIGRAHV